MPPAYVSRGVCWRLEARLESFGFALIALGALVVKAAFTLALVYVGARVAIRHERRISD
jgi:hypothetical protein